MVDITHKIITQRTATARAIVKVGSPATMQAIVNNTVPKGNVIEVSRTAGLFAVKNTSNSIPDCHPMPIEFTGIEFKLLEDSVLPHKYTLPVASTEHDRPLSEAEPP